MTAILCLFSVAALGQRIRFAVAKIVCINERTRAREFP